MKPAYKWIVGGVATGVAGAVWFIIVATNGPEAEYRAELQKGEAAGLPADPSLYQVKVASRDNSLPLYNDAYRQYLRFIKSDRTAGNKISAGEINGHYPPTTALADFKRMSGVFTKLDEAAKRNSLCQGLSYSKGVYGSIVNHSPYRTFMKLRVFRARVLAAESKFDEAFTELEKAATISRHIGTDNPETITMLVQAATRTIVTSGLEQVLCEQGRNPKAAA